MQILGLCCHIKLLDKHLVGVLILDLIAYRSGFEIGVDANCVRLGGIGTDMAQQTDMFNFVSTAADYCGDTPAADPAGISEINTIFKNIGYAVFYGQTTPADAAAQFRTEVNAVLEANN